MCPWERFLKVQPYHALGTPKGEWGGYLVLPYPLGMRNTGQPGVSPQTGLLGLKGTEALTPSVHLWGSCRVPSLGPGDSGRETALELTRSFGALVVVGETDGIIEEISHTCLWWEVLWRRVGGEWWELGAVKCCCFGQWPGSSF